MVLNAKYEKLYYDVLWPDMQKESWNIHLAKILICPHTLNGTDS
jgi:hypothetical protein